MRGDFCAALLCALSSIGLRVRAPSSLVASGGTADAEMGRGISRRVIGNSAVARAWASWKGESGNPRFDVATSKRVCKAGDGPRSWSLMKNRCALFPEHRYPREDGRGPADTGPPGVRVRGRRCRKRLEWMVPRADKNPTTMQILRRWNPA